MYLWHVFKSIFRVNNIGTIIFFLLNASLILALFAPQGEEMMIRMGVIYLISVVIALSPIGEWLLGVFAGARRMTRIDMRNRILPCLQCVYDKAKLKTPTLSDVIIVKLVNDRTHNAMALGRRTICVTTGLFEETDERIMAVLAHEIGHLAHYHTDIQLLVGGGNVFVTAFLMILQGLSALMTAISTVMTLRSRSCLGSCIFGVIGVVSTASVFLWTRFCMLFLMWSNRKNEFEADRYAFELGYGYELAQLLNDMTETDETSDPKDNLFKVLYSSHPDKNDRIGKLQELGVDFSGV